MKTFAKIENKIKYNVLEDFFKTKYCFGKHLNTDIKNLYSTYCNNVIKNSGSDWSFEYTYNYICIGKMFDELIFVEYSVQYDKIIVLSKNFIIVSNYKEVEFKNIEANNICKHDFYFKTINNINKVITFKYLHDGNYILNKFNKNELE